MKRQHFYIGLILFVSITVTVAIGTDSFNLTNETGAKTASTSSSATVEIGGPFTLVDHNGKTVTDADFQGRYKLIFFGYTSCPDVCPTALGGVSEMLDIIGKKSEQIVPLFISVDPKRDTVDVLQEYVTNFHPNIVGLTGSKEQIDSVTRAYRSFYSIEDDGDSNGEFYSVSHSSYLYLMGPDGKFITVFGHNRSPEDMAKSISEII